MSVAIQKTLGNLALLFGFFGLLGFSPSPASAQGLDNEIIPCQEPRVTYFPTQRWPVFATAGDPDHPTPVVYRHGSVGAPNIPGTHEHSAVDRAAATWNGFGCVFDAGTDSWLGGVGVSPSPNVELAAHNDFYPNQDGGGLGQRIVWFRDTGWENLQGIVAATFFVSDAETEVMVDADIEFNTQAFVFHTEDSANGFSLGCAVGSFNCYDVESVALHEFGHFLGLRATSSARPRS